MSKKLLFFYNSEPISALEAILSNKGIHIGPAHQVVTGHGLVLAAAIGMERLGNPLQPHAKSKPRIFIVRPITSEPYDLFCVQGSSSYTKLTLPATRS
jgi:hypothetical protein